MRFSSACRHVQSQWKIYSHCFLRGNTKWVLFFSLPAELMLILRKSGGVICFLLSGTVAAIMFSWGYQALGLQRPLVSVAVWNKMHRNDCLIRAYVWSIMGNQLRICIRGLSTPWGPSYLSRTIFVGWGFTCPCMSVSAFVSLQSIWVFIHHLWSQKKWQHFRMALEVLCYWASIARPQRPLTAHLSLFT